MWLLKGLAFYTVFDCILICWAPQVLTQLKSKEPIAIYTRTIEHALLKKNSSNSFRIDVFFVIAQATDLCQILTSIYWLETTFVMVFEAFNTIIHSLKRVTSVKVKL